MSPSTVDLASYSKALLASRDEAIELSADGDLYFKGRLQALRHSLNLLYVFTEGEFGQADR